MYLFSSVAFISDKKDLKFCLTMATKRSHKEAPLKTKYKTKFDDVFNYKDFQVSNGWLRGWKKR